MTSSKVYRQLIMPTIVPIGVMIVTGALILLIGELLLHLKQETVKHQIERVELWAAVAIAIAILAGCAYIATRPQGTLGKLVKDEALYTEATASVTYLKDSMANLKEILEKINQGGGTIGKLVNDQEFYRNAKLTLQKVDKATESLEDQGPLSVLGIIANGLF